MNRFVRVTGTMDALEEVRRRRLLIDRVDTWLYKEIEPYLGRRVLEAGCGHGNLVKHLLDKDLVIAADLDPGSVALVKERFRGHTNVGVCTYDVCQPPPKELIKKEFDTVVSLNVLEHIQDDCLALSNVRSLLNDGGRLVLIVPALEWLYGTMDVSIGHFRRYTKATLQSKLKRSGFQVETQKYTNLLGALGWFVNGRIVRQRVPPKGQLRWFNAVAPAAMRVERGLHLAFGLSLISVSRVEEST